MLARCVPVAISTTTSSSAMVPSKTSASAASMSGRGCGRVTSHTEIATRWHRDAGWPAAAGRRRVARGQPAAGRQRPPPPPDGVAGSPSRRPGPRCPARRSRTRAGRRRVGASSSRAQRGSDCGASDARDGDLDLGRRRQGTPVDAERPDATRRPGRDHVSGSSVKKREQKAIRSATPWIMPRRRILAHLAVDGTGSQAASGRAARRGSRATDPSDRTCRGSSPAPTARPGPAGRAPTRRRGTCSRARRRARARWNVPRRRR